jgi:hypothetical protein
MNLHKLSKPTSKTLRIGEFLLNSGLIERAQLDEAIEHQCIFGGKLGTCLIELDFIDEWQFAQLLSKYHNLDYIEPHELMNIPQQILDILPKRVAIDNQAVPYRINNNRLFVAISEASDPRTIERLAKASGHIIIPLSIPEIRLKLALHKHYAMTLPTRYESLAACLDARQDCRKKIPKPRRILQTGKYLAPVPVRASAPSKRTAVKTVKANLDTSAWPLLGDQEQQDEQIELTPASVCETRDPTTDKNDFLKRLANIRNREDLADALIDYLAGTFASCALWIVRDQKIHGWKSNRNKNAEFEHLSLDLDHQSLLGTAVLFRQAQLAPLDSFSGNAQLVSFFGASPAQGLAIPLAVGQRIVCVLYLQDKLQKLQADHNELLEIAHKLELTFNMLILKNKILQA